jgi:hypothetical protein
MIAEQATRCVAMITAAFPSWHPTPETVRLYAKFLEAVPVALAERAVMEIIAEPREFPPPVGVIVDRIAKLALAATGRALLSAEEAWAEVQERIHYRGFYQGPGIDLDPILKRVIDAIDWQELCTNSNIEANRAHFFRIYSRFAETELAEIRAEIAAGRMPRIAKSTTHELPAPLAELAAHVTSKIAREGEE